MLCRGVLKKQPSVWVYDASSDSCAAWSGAAGICSPCAGVLSGAGSDDAAGSSTGAVLAVVGAVVSTGVSVGWAACAGTFCTPQAARARGRASRQAMAFFIGSSPFLFIFICPCTSLPGYSRCCRKGRRRGPGWRRRSYPKSPGHPYCRG